MKKNNFKVFLIIEGLNCIVRVPITTFICKDREQAKIYFQNYIKKLKTSTYSLYEIMEITSTGLEEKRMFITSSINIQERQITFEEKMRIKEASKLNEETEKDKIIETLFDARRI